MYIKCRNDINAGKKSEFQRGFEPTTLCDLARFYMYIWMSFLHLIFLIIPNLEGTCIWTKHSKNIKTQTHDTAIAWESFQKFWKLLNFRSHKPLSENSSNFRRKMNGTEIPDEVISKNLGVVRDVVLFSRNSGKCCSTRQWKFLEIQ